MVASPQRSGVLERVLALSLVAVASCNSIVGFGDFQKVASLNARADGGDDDDDDPKVLSSDAGAADTSVAAKCDSTKAFGPATALPGEVNTSAHETAPSLTADELTIVFQRTVGLDGGNLLIATRASRDAPFGATRELTELGVSGVSYDPSITGDGLTIFWAELVDGNSHMNLFSASRTTKDQPFERKLELGRVNSSSDEFSPFVSSDGAELFLTSDRTGPAKLYRSLRNPGTGEYDPPQLFADPGAPSLRFSSDLLTAYFVSLLTNGRGKADVWIASRPSTTAAFGAPVNAGDANTAEDDAPGWISHDDCRLYLVSLRSGKDDIFVATRLP